MENIAFIKLDDLVKKLLRVYLINLFKIIQ